MLAGLRRQTLAADRFEVIVVDDGSLAPAAVDPDGLQVRVLRHERPRGPGAARNSGWRQARADIVAFIDDDCTPDAGWLDAVLRAADRAQVVVQGPVKPMPDQARNPLSHTIEVGGPTMLFVSANIAYPRPLLARLRGFDERFRRAGEDAELGARATKAGAVVKFAPDALVYHEVRDLSLAEHIRHTLKWMDAVGALAIHPELRSLLILGVFWKATHPWLIGASAAFAARRPRIAALALVPYAMRYLRIYRGDARRLARAFPQHLVIDTAEIVTVAVGSVRHRTLML